MIRKFEEIVAWRKARELCKCVYTMPKNNISPFVKGTPLSPPLAKWDEWGF
ncbi:hypothetical protein NBG4_110017 [Candidatus Sulfobium mesophilum]|uniref:Uncharacterized protein n=1 Tax=Candidatus Sulfobium mesophilum TaxID=2016548 RepID=A0A2U3QEA6_9BACT|nr:hypothetical protein NBG4_110017 [Candidatus Sulfobium mesophilum]